MKGRVFALAAGFVAIFFAININGCSQVAPASAPTTAVVEPTNALTAAQTPTLAPAAAPTKAPAAQPTVASAAKVAFPEKGRAITIIVPYAAGGATDLSSRVLASLMERDLGTPVQVVNKPGAASQVGMAEAAAAKPDGYTIVAIVIPGGIIQYLDPERKATYDRKSFVVLGNQWAAPNSISVASNSPYKTVKDLIDASKANPEKIKAGTSGATSNGGLGLLLFNRITGAKLAAVHFDGGSQSITALLGGHIDAVFTAVSDLVGHVKAGNARVLGILDKEASGLMPEVSTLESQGYPVYMTGFGGLGVPAGTPQGVVDILSGAMKRGVESEEFTKKMAELNQGARYMNPDQFAKLWADLEADMQPLLPSLSGQ